MGCEKPGCQTAHTVKHTAQTEKKTIMKKLKNHSTRASALQVTLSVALLSVSAILFASSFKAAPPAAPAGAQPAVVAATGPVSQNAPATLQQDGFYPALAVPAMPQGAFYPPLPIA